MSDKAKAAAWDALIARLKARGDKWAEEECARLIAIAERSVAP